VLYQANQKAYETALLKNFVAHALHPNQVADCFVDKPESCAAITLYLRSVVHNVNAIAEKMIWNAHCRVVNMLASDGKDGAPFLDVHQLRLAMFSDFCPDNPVPIVHRIDESWHRGIPEPAMVRMSTKQYPIGSHASPMEEIDEVAKRLFNNVAFNSALSTGRTTIPLNKRKRKGRGICGAAVRQAPQATSRGNWLRFPLSEAARHSPTHPRAPLIIYETMEDAEIARDGEELHIHQDLRNATYSGSTHAEVSQFSMNDPNDIKAGPTQLEYLYDQYGADALDAHRLNTSARSEAEIVTKAPSWHTRLINDHKRRLAERWTHSPQALRKVLPGIEQVIAEAFVRGYRPTGDDYQNKIRIIKSREQRRCAAYSPEQSSRSDWNVDRQLKVASPSSNTDRSLQTAEQTTLKKRQHVDIPRKRQKLCSSTSSAKKARISNKSRPGMDAAKKKSKELSVKQPITSEPHPSHPSGSMTLELHQALPPDAYFEQQHPDEKPAWRCGIKHAMGYYYNAGNRTACPGCFTNIKESAKSKHMDFYLPSSKYFFQPANDITWVPSKPRSKARRSTHLSHNSRAKEAYWTAIEAGANADEARQAGVEAVEVALRPRSLKQPTPEPTPELEPDLGPHTSGSTAMEHGQDIPECAYFEKHDKCEEYAWRCDVNHALGRYYLAGDKRSCPGCGSNRYGAGKQADMDFYMPLGVVVRQEAPKLCQWTPRKPYKSRKSSPSRNAKVKYLTHNQNCSKRYFEAVEAGCEHGEAVRIAIGGIETELDAKQSGTQEEEETLQSERAEEKISAGTDPRRDSANASENGRAQENRYRHNSAAGCTISLLPKKRKHNEPSDNETNNVEEHETVRDLEIAHTEQRSIEVYSSSDEESSGSDSE
jgi:hypothetical protein